MAPRGNLVATCCALVAALAAAPAAGQPATAVSPVPPPLRPTAAEIAVDRAWSRGVSGESRQAAEALFKEGNAFLRESIVSSAAAKYRDALKHWDHPNIHFNLALALMILDQPVETHEHLVQATRYGPEPLEKERYEHARNYIALLDRQLARFSVRCDVPGAQVSLDGRPLFEPPGKYEGLVRAGSHTIVASKAGYVTNQSVRVLEGGTASAIDLPLRTVEDMTRTTRRWDAWVPWTVLGGGAAVALAGGWMQREANDKNDWVDEESAKLCPPPSGCPGEPQEIADARDQADRLETGSIVAYSVGAATLVTGAVLLYLNRAHTAVMPYEEPSAPPPRAALEVAPVIERGGAGVVAKLRF